MAHKLARSRRAFTLVEVLVVVAIIALLISILLPSLAVAREQAKSVVCSTRLSQILRAEATYESTSRGWFAGSPLTTGYSLTKNGDWNPNLPGFTRTALDWMDFSTALRIQMYGPSSLPTPTPANFVEARKRMYLKVTDEPFLCPSNAQTAPPFPANSGFPVIHATSYLSMWTMMRAGPATFHQIDTLFPGSSVSAGSVAQSETWEMAVPDDYVPRDSRIGVPSLKVFLADGVRYFNGEPDNTIDYSIDPNGAKGMMSAEPPSTYAPANPTYAREYVMAKKYSYRHGNGERINAAFFDGHVESLQAGAKGNGPFKGPAVHPKYYFPSKTIVKDPTKLHMSNIPVNTILP